MRRKITFCTYDAPLFHSVNSWLKRLLPELNNNNFLVQVLAFYEGDLTQCETYQYCTRHGFSINVFPYNSLTEEKIKWILETLSSDPPDVFVPNMMVAALYASKWLKIAGIPCVGVIHSDEPFYEAVIHVFVNGPEEYRLSAIVPVSKYLFNKINPKKPDHVICRCIPCGVPLNNGKPTSFNKSVLTMIYIGRLAEKQKRISDVVRGMCKASNQIQGVEGIIYGHGEEQKVKELIQKYGVANKVKFGGSLSNDKVFEELSKAQIFVLLSDYEGLPQTLLEAMACGLVPICSDIKSGIPELITPNKTGIIVTDRNSSFIRAVKMVKNNPSFFEEISKNVKEKAIEYSMELSTMSWVALLNELVEKNNSAKQIQIPTKIQLSKQHRHLKSDDFRPLTNFKKILNRIRRTKIVRFIKRSIKS